MWRRTFCPPLFRFMRGWLLLCDLKVFKDPNVPISAQKQKKSEDYFHNLPIFSDSDRIQTCNRLIRSQVLYSVELRSRIASANVGQISDTCKYFAKKIVRRPIFYGTSAVRDATPDPNRRNPPASPPSKSLKTLRTLKTLTPPKKAADTLYACRTTSLTLRS